MAKFYAKERSKVGSLTGSIIVWPVELDNNNPNSDENKSVLPAGYLKCDGAKYNASAYPELAEICGTGENCKFVRKDIDGKPKTTLTYLEFVVPDLGSKYPRPVPGADAGTYNSINTKTQAGVAKIRSGMGIEATSTIGQSTQILYTGTFTVPQQTINLTGKPSWSKGTNNLGYTDSEAVDAAALHPHMHFSTTKRCRIKSTNTTTADLQLGSGRCYYKTASTINIETWLDNTRINGSSSYFKGSNQPPCWAIASRNAVKVPLTNPESDVAGLVDRIYYNACISGSTASSLQYNCLLNKSTSNQNYDLASDSYALGNGSGSKYTVSTYIFFGCVSQNEGGWNPVNDSNNASGVPARVTTLYVAGATGVPEDWKNLSLEDVVPLNINATSTSSLSYPQVENIVTEVAEIAELQGDRTIHNHKLALNKGDHTFKIKTDAFLLSPDALSTKMTISTDTAASLDAVSSPYIILEYLIKF